MKFESILLSVLTTMSLSVQALPKEQAKPIRMAKVRGEIAKSTMTQVPFSYDTQKVCDFEAEVPVFADTKGLPYSLPNVAECESTLKRKDVVLQIVSNIKISERTEHRPTNKSANATLLIYSTKDPNALDSVNVSSGSENLEVKTMLVGFTSASYPMPESEKQETETFLINMTFDDSAQ